MSLKRELKEDRIYQRHMEKIAALQDKEKAWIEELESQHITRAVRSLNSNQLLQSAQKISIDGNLNNQASRSRCVELKLRALKQIVVMEESLDLLRKYIASRFSATLKEDGHTTVAERKAAIDWVLQPIEKRKKRLDHVVKIADIIIDDCDAAGYTLHRIGTALEQKSRDR